ncbi:T9SS type A sorting domain-containing protein [Empedobacter brevis]|uniref:T9SS type A sorting domain-containing protein n=1 Tax=Empedobacter brevis TaxID=247 RepID=UPI0033408913
MKRFYFLNYCLLFLFLGLSKLSAQCPEGQAGLVQLKNQEELDAFLTNYPNCTELNRDLRIGNVQSGSNITDVSGLKNLKKVQRLHIEYNQNLQTLTGLEQLQTAQRVTIQLNNNLTSIEGLSALTNVEESLSISNNENLQRLKGLEKIKNIGGLILINNPIQNLEGLNQLESLKDGLSILNNPLLSDLSALSKLTKAGGLYIRNNRALPSLSGLEQLSEITLDVLQISNNYNLKNIDALSGLKSVKNIQIEHNAQLSNLLGLNNLNITQLEALKITYNPLLTYCNSTSICTYIAQGGISEIKENSIGCSSTQEISSLCRNDNDCPEGDIQLKTQAEVDAFLMQYPNCAILRGHLKIGTLNENSDIHDLSKFQNLSAIVGGLFIYNSQLENLNGLQTLTQIAGDLIIENNSKLTDLSAFYNLFSINSSQLIIRNNDMLEALWGLDNLNPKKISNLIVSSSQNLSMCNVPSICKYVSAFGSQYELSGNATGCNSFDEEMFACRDWGMLPECPEPVEDLSTGKYSVNFNSQEEINHFKIQFPDCTQINDLVRIEGINSNITDLTSFEKITALKGLVISNTNISSLYGFHHLQSATDYLDIGGNKSLVNLNELSQLKKAFFVDITRNDLLENLDGLNQLSFVNKLNIANNLKLKNLNGLDQLTALSDGFDDPQFAQSDLSIGYNAQLINLEGLKLKKVNGSISIMNNESLQNLNGLQSLIQYNGDLRIQDNPKLTSIEALGNVTSSIDEEYGLFGFGGLQIAGNPLLANLNGLHHIKTAGWVSISGNHSLTDLKGLGNITKLSELSIYSNDKIENLNGLSPNLSTLGVLKIANNPQLVRLDGLNNLAALSRFGYIHLENNPLLNDLTALSNLRKMGYQSSYLKLKNNQSLTSLKGLENIDANSLDNIMLTDSPNLSQCNVKSICDFLTNSGENLIFNNATGCNSPQEILTACNLSIDDVKFSDDLIIYPNPVKTQFNIQLKTNEKIRQLKIYNMTGQEVYDNRFHQQHHNISHLSKGLYIVIIKTDTKSYQQKLIKE